MKTPSGRRRARGLIVLFAVIAAASVLCLTSIRSATVENFTDADGDTYEVSLSGPGTVAVTVADAQTNTGAIQQLELTGTTAASVLKVSVTQNAGGDGIVAIGSLTGNAGLKSVIAPQSPLSGALSLGGGLGRLVIGDIAAGANVTVGPPAKPGATRISAGRIGSATIQAAGKIGALTATAIEGATISAAAIGTVKITGGCDLVLSTPGRLVSLRVEGGDLSGRISAQSIGPITVRKNGSGAGGSIVAATIAAAKDIGAITVAGEMRDSLILAGADLGKDGELGGIGEDSDSFAAGRIGRVKITGNVSGSIVGAGLSPFDGVFRDDNDGIFGGKRSKITALILGGLSAESRVGAGTLGAVKIGGVKLRLPQLDPRFITRRLTGTPPPPDPAKNAPKLDPTVPTNLADATAFLYTGANAIQTGVVSGTIDPVRAAVIRGVVEDRTGAPLGVVTISILNRPEFGETMSRADGRFDLAVNGGGVLNVRYEKEGFLSAQRQVEVAPQDYTIAPDVVLTGADPAVTQVVFGGAAPLQMHEATVQTDEDGPRHAALMFTPGTSASLVMPDGTSEPMSSLNIRATEYTVGANGPTAMPALLPPTSAYTYCVELSADEATAVGATSVQFDKPVWFYLENFLNFPPGIDVPIGFFDREKGVWVPRQSGLVIKIVSINGGAADLDVTGDGNADTGAALDALNITESERQQLGARYAAGQSLWRAPIQHFSTVDANWSGSPGNPAGTPNGGEPKPDKQPDDPDDPPNVYIQNQVLGESLPISGTPFTLNYRSNRVTGYRSSSKVRIPLSGASLTGAVQRIDLAVTVAGRTFKQEFAPAPNLETTFEWDGLDAYGRTVQGAQPATIRLSNIYRGVYMGTRRFGFQGEFELEGNPTRRETAVTAIYSERLGNFDIRRQSLGGWTFDVHHTYDPQGRVLYQGDGTTRSVQNVSRVIATVAGTGQPGFSGDGGPATQAQLRSPWGVGVMGDGSLLIADRLNHRIRRVDPSGLISTFAGTGSAGFSGDGSAATQAQFNEPTRAQFAPDGSVYIDDKNNLRIRRILPNGVITTAAGTGTPGNTGDNGLATQAQLGGDPDPFPAIDGTIYFSDIGNNRIRRIDTAGIISAVAGTGSQGFSGDGGQALQATFRFPVDLVPTREGALFIGDLGNNRIRRIGPDGIITTVAGGGADSTTEAVPALQANLNFASGVDLAPAPDDGVYFSERQRRRIRHLRADGTIVTIAGNGTSGSAGDGGPALQAQLQNPFGLAVGPDGSLYIGDSDAHRVRRVGPPLPGFTADDIAIPSEDGAQLFRFDSAGRHLTTVSVFTGATLYAFAYDSDGQLAKITDPSGNVTVIQRSIAGGPVEIVGPFGQKTTLTTNAVGSLASIRDPAGGTYSFVTTPDGLITSETNPNGNTTAFTYDSSGRLTRSDSAGPAQVELVRTDLPSGSAVEVRNALGTRGSYQAEKLADGSELRTNTDAAGLVTTELRSASGVITITTPDGMVSKSTLGSDPRFGFQAPVQTTATITTPGGKTATLQTTRTVSLSNPNDPLSLTSWTDTFTRNGRNFITSFDAATKTLTLTSPLGRQHRQTVDERGATVRQQRANLAPTVRSYDSSGRLVSITTGTGLSVRTVSRSYDADGFVATSTDELGSVTRFAFDPAGRITRLTDPSGRTVVSAYDPSGNLLSLTTPAGNMHRLTFTQSDMLGSYAAPDVAGAGPAVTTFEFNTADQLTTQTNPDGLTVESGYDAAQRDVSRTVAAGVTTYSYDAAGRMGTVTAPDGGTLSFIYDGSFLLGRTWAGEVAGSVTRTINNDFRTASQSVNGAGTVSFTYDNDGLLTSAGALTLTRDATTGLVSAALLGSIAETFTYDEFAELTTKQAAFNGSAFFIQALTYDKLGRTVQKAETIGGVTDTFTYAYNASGELTEVKKNGATIESYAYDLDGNRTVANNQAATFDARDRITQFGNKTFTYTAAGSLLTATSGGETTHYNYDALGSLLSVALPGGATIDYVLDGASRRIGRKINGTLTSGFLYYDALRIAAELDVTGQVVSRFVYGSRRTVPDYMVRGGVTYRIFTDINCSVRLVVDVATGVVTQRIDYDAYGRVLSDTAPGFQPFGFAGGIYDPLTHLVRFGVRDYDAETGRWTAPDPAIFTGGQANLYAYVANDPVNRIDPLGLKHRNCNETRDLLKKAFQDSSQPGVQGLLNVLNNHKGNGKFDFKINGPDDTFTIVDKHGKQRVLNAGQFGNYIAGYASNIASETSGATGAFGYAAVHGAGIGFDLADATINQLFDFNPNNRFDFDADSWDDIDAGFEQAKRDRARKQELNGCP